MKKFNLLVLFISLLFIGINVYAEEIYSVYIGEEEFTEDRLTIEDGKGGTATYDPEKHLLTIKDFDYEGLGRTCNFSGHNYRCAIASYYSGLKIIFEGNNNFELKYLGENPDNVLDDFDWSIYYYDAIGIGILDYDDSHVTRVIYDDDDIVEIPSSDLISTTTIGGTGTVNFKMGYADEVKGIYSTGNLVFDDGIIINIEPYSHSKLNLNFDGIYGAYVTIKNANITIKKDNNSYGDDFLGVGSLFGTRFVDGVLDIDYYAGSSMYGVMSQYGDVYLDNGKIDINLNGLYYKLVIKGDNPSTRVGGSIDPVVEDLSGYVSTSMYGISSGGGNIILKSTELNIYIDVEKRIDVEDSVLAPAPGVITRNSSSSEKVGDGFFDDVSEGFPRFALFGLDAFGNIELNGGMVKITIPKYGYIYQTGDFLEDTDTSTFSYKNYKSFKYQSDGDSDVVNITKKDKYLFGVYFETNFYTYLLVNGDKQSVSRLSGAYTLEIDGDPEKLSKVLINGEEYEKGKDYTVEGDKVIFTESGIAKITELEPQEYEFEVVYTLDDGDKSIKGTLTVQASAPVEEDIANPETFDNIIIYGLIGVISLIGLYILFINKKRFN